MIRFLPLIRRNSYRNKRRTILTALSIGISVCLLALFFSLYQSLFVREPSPSQALHLITRHRVSLTNFLPIAYEDKIRAVPGVAEVSSLTWFGGIYKDNRDPNNAFSTYAVEPDRYFHARPDLKIDSDVRSAFFKERTACVATRELARKLGWKTGERITIMGDMFPVNLELVVAGLFVDPGTGGDQVLFNRDYLRELLPSTSEVRDSVGTFYILADSADSMPRISRAIDKGFHNGPQPTKTESEKQFSLAFLAFVGNLKLFLGALSAAVIFTLLLVSGNTMAISIRERAREVGILKALGFSGGQVLGIILGEAAVISLIGGFAGLLLATFLVSGLKILASIARVSVSPPIWALCLGVAVTIGLLGAFLPAHSAAKTSVLAALRSNG